MKPPAETVREIIKGLEGLQMLSQWEQSLAKDLAAKAELLLKATRGDPPAADSSAPQPDDAP